MSMPGRSCAGTLPWIGMRSRPTCGTSPTGPCKPILPLDDDRTRVRGAACLSRQHAGRAIARKANAGSGACGPRPPDLGLDRVDLGPGDPRAGQAAGRQVAGGGTAGSDHEPHQAADAADAGPWDELSRAEGPAVRIAD